MLGTDGETRTLGAEIHGVRSVRVDDFRVRSSDLTFRLNVAIDLERLVTAAPARWAVSALAERPEDEARRERAVAAVQAAGQELEEGTSRFDLAVVRIDGAGVLGGISVLYGQQARTGERLAYVLTPDLRLADLIAADRGLLAREFVDGLSPLDVSGTLEGSWEVRVKEVLARFGVLITVHPGDELPGDGAAQACPAIVRASPSPGPLSGRHVRQYSGLGGRTRQALSRLGLVPAHSG
ncbi:hypothetical protein [Kineosporia babensis]|uniref:Uncharacterized protein n=1 Tax=Kineosporia babensis TaxID=499548 RepID=A0A9X1NMA4_9ACTN|nr:hypothetical protein [Kineosporia babensis]MCD5316394.1 hypothetical protein [Kineosporia babensis]